MKYSILFIYLRYVLFYIAISLFLSFSFFVKFTVLIDCDVCVCLVFSVLKCVFSPSVFLSYKLLCILTLFSLFFCSVILESIHTHVSGFLFFWLFLFLFLSLLLHLPLHFHQFFLANFIKQNAILISTKTRFKLRNVAIWHVNHESCVLISVTNFLIYRTKVYTHCYY